MQLTKRKPAAVQGLFPVRFSAVGIAIRLFIVHCCHVMLWYVNCAPNSSRVEENSLS